MCTKERALDGPREFEVHHSFNTQELVFVMFPDVSRFNGINARTVNGAYRDSSCLLFLQADSMDSMDVHLLLSG